eukprot:m.263960 g.263960  ORF g.263960 m.263960 type:complete len:380 (-) comp27400_c0_seq1:74-1213(-)
MSSEEERAALREKIAKARTKAPAALSPDEIKERNRKALEARKAKLAKKKEEELKRPLPPGWKRVESKSRPGEFVYENINTEERIAWFPEEAAQEEVSAPLVAEAADKSKKEEMKKKNLEALKKFKAEKEARKKELETMELPEGWKKVESRSRPGEMVYENTVTGERQAWFPDAPAVDPKEAEKKARAEKNRKALEAFKAKQAAKKADEAKKPLPEGWKRVESRSRPGEYVYENIYTEERVAWFPDAPAEKPLPEGWRKVESRTYPGEFVYENMYTYERQAWLPTEKASTEPSQPAEPPQKRTEDQLAALADNRAPPARNIVCKARAAYDYTAANPEEEIDLAEGDVIAVEFKAENGWWVGINTRTRRTGIFPGSYVEII